MLSPCSQRGKLQVAHFMQVELYADYAPGQLMAFLVSSQWYPLEAALGVCEQRGLVREQVFILGRMGSASQALHLIIQRLADIPQVPIAASAPAMLDNVICHVLPAASLSLHLLC